MLSFAHDSPGSVMDELTAPLGLSQAPQRRFSSARIFSIGLAGLLLAGGALWLGAHKGVLGEKPTSAAAAPTSIPMQVPPAAAAPASIPLQVPPAATAPPALPMQTPPAAPALSNEATGSIRNPADGAPPRTVTIIDGISGKRQEVVIGSPDTAPAGAARQRSH
jgi:hypothetical protein